MKKANRLSSFVMIASRNIKRKRLLREEAP